MDHPSPDTMWRYALADLPLRRRRAVREHALACDTCRRDLSRNLTARRALGGDALQPSPAELSAWEGEILGRALGHRRRRAWLGGGLAAALATAAAVLFLVPRADDELTARGGVESALVLRVLCVDATAPSDTRVLDPAVQSCPVGSYLKVMVGGLDSTRKRFAVVAVSGAELWHLYPGERDGPLLSLSAEIAALPGSFVLESSRRGSLRVVLLAGDAERLSVDDPVWDWMRRASSGSYRGLFERFDVMVEELAVGGER